MSKYVWFIFLFSVLSSNLGIARNKVSREDLEKHFDMSNPTVDLSKLIAPGLAKDAIPSIDKPERIPLSQAKFPGDDGRIAVVKIGETTVGYPLGILMFHEIVNDKVGGLAIAVTYCPLCDSVAVVERSFDNQVYEFGVSGFLLNSNVVMYERKTKSLWSQAYMQAITGKHSGKSLKHLPVKMVTMKQFRKENPKAYILKRPNAKRPYGRNPYKKYWDSDKDYYKDFNFVFGKKLKAKTLGLGVKDGKKAWYITQKMAAKKPVVIKTSKGEIEVLANESGMFIKKSPEGIQSLQTFYHTWSAFYPATEVLALDEEFVKR